MAQIELPWVISIVLVLALGWALFQLVVLRRGIGVLIDLCRREELPSYNQLPPIVTRGLVGGLTKRIWKLTNNSELQQVSSEGVRRIQKVLLDQVADVLLLVDGNLEIKFANRAAHTFFQTNDSPISGPLVEICLDHRICELVSDAIDSDQLIHKQLERTQESQTIIISTGRIDPAYEIGDGAWLAIRDVSNEVHTEQIRKDFVANASHELRTPLSIIKGYLELMEEDSSREKEISIMTKHTDRLSRIVEDMLLISRFENDQDQNFLNLKQFDIGECAHSIVAQLQPLIDEREAKVKIKMPENPADRLLNGDQFYWDQVFFNLIENALKENLKPGLKIAIRIKPVKKAGGYQIQIEDNGVGIPAADIDDIFKRFYRGDKSHSRQNIKGTGLGLSIVKRAVEAHRGTIEVTSQPGFRTTFTIRLDNDLCDKLGT